MNRLDAIKAVREAVDRSETLTAREKRRIKASVRWRPRVRAEVAGLVLAEACVEGLVDEDGEVAAAIQWDQILSFIERLLPLILQLVSLFG